LRKPHVWVAEFGAFAQTAPDRRDIHTDCVEMGVYSDLFKQSLGPVSRVKWFETVRW